MSGKCSLGVGKTRASRAKTKSNLTKGDLNQSSNDKVKTKSNPTIDNFVISTRNAKRCHNVSRNGSHEQLTSIKGESVDKKQTDFGATKSDVSSGSPNSLDTTKEDPEFDDLAGLKLFSQEALDVSGDSDVQCEVRWDCYSPETVKHLRKLRGQHNAEGVKRIVANFNDAHVKPQKQTMMKMFPYSFGPEPTTMFKDISQRRERRAARSKPQRITSKKAVEEMILLLQGRMAKQQREAAGLAEEDTELLINNVGATEDNIERKTNDKDADDCWSDDDLFRDNSFLIEATQNPEKFINTSVDMSQAVRKYQSDASETTTVFSKPAEKMFEPLSDQSPNSSFIPSSCAQKPKVAPVSNLSNNFKLGSHLVKPYAPNSKNSLSKFQTGKRYPITTQSAAPHSNSNPKTYTSASVKATATAYNAKFTSSVNKFANQNINKPLPSSTHVSVIQNSQQPPVQNSQIINLPPGSKIKSSFRKHNSFQNDKNASTYKSTILVGNHQSPSSTLNNSFKRTLSFDNVTSSSKSTIPMSSNSKPLSVISKNYPQTIGAARQSATTVLKKNSPTLFTHPSSNLTLKQNIQSFKPIQQQGHSVTANNATSDVSMSATDDGFDMSISEDVLQQLLEVDEIFDTQADILSTGKPVVTTSSTKVPCNEADAIASTASLISPPQVCGHKSVSALAMGANLGSLRSNTPVRPFKQRASLLEPNASTPAKLAKATASSTEDAVTTDSGMELFDSFLNEDVFESQILPFLEKIEGEENGKLNHEGATAVPPVAASALLSPSPMKCSPDEIEQKRQAALERRSLRLSQMKTKSGSR